MEKLSRQGLSLDELIHEKILTQDGANVIRHRQYSRTKYHEDFEYYDRLVKNGYDLADHGPTITTIHGSKGRQRENVVVFSEMGRKCLDDWDTEHRLAYVAATRTQGDVTICKERTVEWAEVAYDYPTMHKEVVHAEF
jgi:superfamily I DNA/RNA helicase